MRRWETIHMYADLCERSRSGAVATHRLWLIIMRQIYRFSEQGSDSSLVQR